MKNSDPIHSLDISTKPTNSVRKKILSFSGAFSNMSDKDYRAFVKQTKKNES